MAAFITAPKWFARVLMNAPIQAAFIWLGRCMRDIGEMYARYKVDERSDRGGLHLTLTPTPTLTLTLTPTLTPIQGTVPWFYNEVLPLGEGAALRLVARVMRAASTTP